MSTKDEMLDELATRLQTDSFVLPKNLQNLLGVTLSKELTFDEDASFLVTHTFTADRSGLLVTFASENELDRYCCIFYYRKSPSNNWWFLDEKFRLVNNPAIRILKGIAAGGSISLESIGTEDMIILDVLQSQEVLMWRSTDA